MAEYDFDKLKESLGIASSKEKFVPDVQEIASYDPNLTGEPDPSVVPQPTPLTYKIGQAVAPVFEKTPSFNPIIEASKAGLSGIKNIVSGVKGEPIGQDKQVAQSANIQQNDQTAGTGGVDPNQLAGAVKPVDPMAGFGAGYDLASQGYKEIGQAQTNAYNQMAEERAKLQAEKDAQIKAQQVRVDEYNAKMNTAYEDYAKKNVSIDNFWADRATGSKILAGIGIILGGIGQSKGQKTNVGLDVLNQAIDRDIAIQRANLDKEGRGLEFQRGILSDQLKNFKDLDDAVIASKMLIFQQIEDKLKANSANPQAKVMIGQLQAQKQILGAKLQANAAKGGTMAIQQLTSQADADFNELKKTYGKGGMVSRALSTTPLIQKDRREKIDGLNASLKIAALDVMGRAGATQVKPFLIDWADSPEEIEMKRKKFKQVMENAYIYKKNKPLASTSDTMDEELDK